MLTDTHAHLDYEEFEKDLDAVVARAREAGVARIIAIGTNVESSRKAVGLAERFPEVFATVGVHPNEAGNVTGEWITELKRMAGHPRVVAIGEAGLDYHRLPGAKLENPFEDALAVGVAEDPVETSRRIVDEEFKNTQADVFHAQLDLAVELGLNVVVHQRDAWEDTLDMLDAYAGRLQGVFHCFGGTPEDAREVIHMGHLVSFTGIVTFKNAAELRETVASVPGGKFMVETDCPYLAPEPDRGKRCEPRHARAVAERIAEARRMTLEHVAMDTTAAAEAFFRFGRGAGKG